MDCDACAGRISGGIFGVTTICPDAVGEEDDDFIALDEAVGTGEDANGLVDTVGQFCIADEGT